MSKTRKVLATAVVLGLTSAAGGWATYSAFSSTTSSSNNSFAAGTVRVGDNSLGAFMYQVADQKPGDPAVTRCIKVTYTGTLDAAVKLYVSPVAAVGQYVDMTITPGTGSPAFPGCTGFTPDAGGAIYTGTLKGFADTHGAYATGFVDNPGATATDWSTNESVVYQISLSLQDNNNANGGAAALSTGAHTFTWEARNL